MTRPTWFGIDIYEMIEQEETKHMSEEEKVARGFYRAEFGSTFIGQYASELERRWHRYLERRCCWPVRYVGAEHSHKDFEIELPSGVLPVEVKPNGPKFVSAALERLIGCEQHGAVVTGKPPGRQWWYYHKSENGENFWFHRVPAPRWPADPVPGWRKT